MLHVLVIAVVGWLNDQSGGEIGPLEGVWELVARGLLTEVGGLEVVKLRRVEVTLRAVKGFSDSAVVFLKTLETPATACEDSLFTLEIPPIACEDSLFTFVVSPVP